MMGGLGGEGVEIVLDHILAFRLSERSSRLSFNLFPQHKWMWEVEHVISKVDHIHL